MIDYYANLNHKRISFTVSLSNICVSYRIIFLLQILIWLNLQPHELKTSPTKQPLIR